MILLSDVSLQPLDLLGQGAWESLPAAPDRALIWGLSAIRPSTCSRDNVSPSNLSTTSHISTSAPSATCALLFIGLGILSILTLQLDNILLNRMAGALKVFTSVSVVIEDMLINEMFSGDIAKTSRGPAI